MAYVADSGTARALSVSDLNSLVKEALENQIGRVVVRGELSNCKPASSGHWYFSLCDDNALVSAVMFRNRIIGLPFIPADGMEVEVSGSISVYEKRGTYQIVCESMSRLGEGNILLMLEERKRKLAAEGLFDQHRKKSLPLFPQKIAVITSPTGAAIRDILHVLGRRAAGIDVVVIPVPVQGDAAAEKIAAGIRLVDKFGMADVMIVGRGGGSIEDLLPFSDEAVVRAIADCTIPVISAVGHEVDFALSDFAADLRAPTPSAAAELVAASREELLLRVMNAGKTIVRFLASSMREIRRAIRPFSRDQLEQGFRAYLQPYFMRLDDAKEGLVLGMKAILQEQSQKLALLQRDIAACSPYDILSRGYAIIEHQATGTIAGSIHTLFPDDRITIRMHDGSTKATINNPNKNQGACHEF